MKQAIGRRFVSDVMTKSLESMIMFRSINMNFKPWGRGHIISTTFATEDRRLPKHGLLQLKQGGRPKSVAKLSETSWRMG